MLLDAKKIAKFSDPDRTVDGKRRAKVGLESLETLWFNTGTVCNLSCQNCYIESSPSNDRLSFISKVDVESFLEEIKQQELGTREIGFTGGEPFANPEFSDILEVTLERGFHVLVLTNAMQPMQRKKERLLELQQKYSDQLTFRVSLDHYSEELHDLERGKGAWKRALVGLKWLSENRFQLSVAGRFLSTENETEIRERYLNMFTDSQIDCDSEKGLVLFPEMETGMSSEASTPEISVECWGILNKTPSDVMCAKSRMVVKRKGEVKARVSACTLIAYEEEFLLGETLREASQSVSLNHPFCSQFCVLGGASCS